MADIRVLIACGAGVATSTVIADRVRSLVTDAGDNPVISQVKIVEVPARAPEFDLVVASTQAPPGLETPFVNAVPYLTGVGEEAVDQKITEVLQSLHGEAQ